MLIIRSDSLTIYYDRYINVQNLILLYCAFISYGRDYYACVTRYTNVSTHLILLECVLLCAAFGSPFSPYAGYLCGILLLHDAQICTMPGTIKKT